MEFTAKHFDEIILDDFFFTNCKCELCINAKGDKSWTRYRLDLMTEAAQSLVIGPAKISLFVYDNNTFIVESFLPEEAKIRIVTDAVSGKITDIITGEQGRGDGKTRSMIWGRNPGESVYFDITLKPHSYRVFKCN